MEIKDVYIRKGTLASNKEEWPNMEKGCKTDLEVEYQRKQSPNYVVLTFLKCTKKLKMSTISTAEK